MYIVLYICYMYYVMYYVMYQVMYYVIYVLCYLVTWRASHDLVQLVDVGGRLINNTCIEVYK
jgi:hypothetical protein